MNTKIIASEKYKEKYSGIPFAYSVIYNVDLNYLKEFLKNEKQQFSEKLSLKLEKIKNNIECFNDFFNKKSYKCPLEYQLSQAIKKGPPTIQPLVDLLLISEMNHGLLLGIQDVDAVSGDLILDLANDNERFAGMAKQITCRAGEIVIRDNESIIASYFQGPDAKTKIKKTTKNIIVFAFSAPGIRKEILKEAIQDIYDAAGISNKELLQVYVI